ncbi:MAG: EpsI family protein, partial [Anaerolineae bacterium]|nr:EpsI family protein [Anaerolineae bacterium]
TRWLLLLTLIVLVGGATFFLAYARPTPPVPTPSVRTTTTPLYTYLIDVAGWYEITPNERAVASPYDFTFDRLTAMPPHIGNWIGEAYDYGRAVDEWFENPDVAVSSIYRDARGNQVWFSAFGSRGRKSYFLFEHTPITSYPAAGWTLIEHGVTAIPIGDRQMRVQKATLALAAERRVVFYWYLWSDFTRAPDAGILTMRLHVPVTSTDQAAFKVGADFLRALFPQVITWRRF